MAVLRIEGLSDAMMAALKHVAHERGMTLKGCIVRMLRDGLERDGELEELPVDIPGDLRRIAGMIEARQGTKTSQSDRGFRGIPGKGLPGSPHDLAYSPED